VIALICAWLLGAAEADPKALELVDRYQAVYQKAKTLTFILRKSERLRDGRTVNEASFAKVRKPQDVYLAQLEPRKGQEVLYVPSKNNTQLRAHTGSFPDVTVMIDVHGDLALKNQHHPVYHVVPGYGLAYMYRGAHEAGNPDSHGKALFKGEETRFGRPVMMVELVGGKPPPKKIVAKKNERLMDFAHRNNADPYVVYMANPKISGLNSRLDENASYVVPMYYGERNVFAFDKETGFLLEQTIYDADGELYERIGYDDLKIDPPLTDLDFDEKNPAYKF
jgi:Protein of unknown function (DUF1571)